MSIDWEIDLSRRASDLLMKSPVSKLSVVALTPASACSKAALVSAFHISNSAALSVVAATGLS